MRYSTPRLGNIDRFRPSPQISVMSTLLDKIKAVIKRYHEIEESMADPEIAANFERVQELARERAPMENLVKIGTEYKELVAEIEDLE